MEAASQIGLSGGDFRCGSFYLAGKTGGFGTLVLRCDPGYAVCYPGPIGEKSTSPGAILISQTPPIYS